MFVFRDWLLEDLLGSDGGFSIGSRTPSPMGHSCCGQQDLAMIRPPDTYI